MCCFYSVVQSRLRNFKTVGYVPRPIAVVNKVNTLQANRAAAVTGCRTPPVCGVNMESINALAGAEWCVRRERIAPTGTEPFELPASNLVNNSEKRFYWPPWPVCIRGKMVWYTANHMNAIVPLRQPIRQQTMLCHWLHLSTSKMKINRQCCSFYCFTFSWLHDFYYFMISWISTNYS